MVKRFLLITLTVTVLAAGFWYATRPPAPAARPPITNASSEDTSGFARALVPIEFQFPKDHGPHEDFQTEWWYYTGNLQAENGERFGYQFTIFRRGLSPGQPGETGLLTNQVYFSHFAITDVAAQTHRGIERFSRGAAGLAGASGEPFRAWLEDWRIDSLNAEGSAVRLQGQDEQMALDLNLRALKPIVLQGERGLSAKSSAAGNASYYLSFTRMATEGTVRVNGRTVKVTGESWFDHEWSTSVLGPNAVGWDWFSLQLSDGRDLMLYVLRLEDGGVEAVSGGTLVERDGATRPIKLQDFSLAATGSWASPVSQAVYPSGWRLQIPTAQLDLTIDPYVQAQEMQISVNYWEGAVQVSGTFNGQPVSGNGYVELTGYTDSLQGVLGRGQGGD